MPIARKSWYVVDVYYETIGGDLALSRTPPMRDMAAAMRLKAEYAETGHRAEVIEVPAPEATKVASGRATKTGAHD